MTLAKQMVRDRAMSHTWRMGMNYGKLLRVGLVATFAAPLMVACSAAQQNRASSSRAAASVCGTETDEVELQDAVQGDAIEFAGEDTEDEGDGDEDSCVVFADGEGDEKIV